MRSKQLALEKYDSDKITSPYLQFYDPIFQPWVEQPIHLLELGIYKGGSLLLWRDYFPQGTIVGIDIKLPEGFQPPERVTIHEGSQADTQFLTRVANLTAPKGYDIIIDDASHIGELTRTAFWHLFDKHLKPGGIYVIEDWGTGYWQDWPDGKRLDLQSYTQPSSGVFDLWNRLKLRLGRKVPMLGHSYGMVGFVKQLVDEQAAGDVTRGGWRGSTKRGSKFKEMTIAPGLVFVRKAG